MLARGLARDPKLRFPSTGEFFAALENAVVTGADELTCADEPSAADARTRPGFARPTRRPILLFGLAMALLALALARYRAPVSRPPRGAPTPIAMQPAQAAPPLPVAPAAVAPPLPVRIVDAPAPSLPRALPRAAHHDEPAPAAMDRAALQRAEAPQEPPLLIAPIAPNDVPVATAPAGSSLGRVADRELLQGHLARAVELFERAIAEDPADAAAFRGLGLAQERLGHSAAAVRAYRSAIALEPQGAHSAKLRERLQRLGSRD